MENWRKFKNQIILEKPTIKIPASTDTKKYQNIIKSKKQKGLQSFDFQYIGDKGKPMTEKYSKLFLKEMVTKPMELETLRNLVRYFVKKYCKNKKILKLFNQTEKLEVEKIGPAILKLRNRNISAMSQTHDHSEEWGSDNATAAGHAINLPAKKGIATQIKIYKNPNWEVDSEFLIDKLFKLIEPKDEFLNFGKQKYEFSSLLSFSRFLNMLRAIQTAVTYVHELAHVTDPNFAYARLEPQSSPVEQMEIYATTHTIKFINNVIKNIKKEVFESPSVGNYDSWGTPNQESINSAKLTIDRFLKDLLDHEVDYQMQQR